jgi:acyl-CoA synthetase
LAFSLAENNIATALLKTLMFAGGALKAMRNIPDELVTRYEEAGWWTRESLGQVLAHGLQAAPDATFRVYSDIRPWSGTFADVEMVARRLAAGLCSRGVGAGDVVAFQLPNWMEAAATFWASAFLGATLVPIVHFYGRKELAHIFAAAKPRVFLTAEEFGRLTYQPDLCADIEIVGVVGRDFDDLLADEPLSGTVPADAADPALIAFTSGTTSAPKGVVHSHRSLVFEARQLSGQIRSIGDNQLTATPVGHFIGMLAALLIPVLNGGAVHLVDNWDPGAVLALMDRDGLTLGGGPPYFVTSLLDHPDCTPAHRARIKTLGLGGSTVPATVTRRLSDMGIIVFRSYGSSEHPSITGSTLAAPEDKRLLTDGCPMPGVEIRLAADGEIFSRGPDLFMGYTDDALTAAAFDDDGWYRTGDVGVLDADGYLTITDRKADVIIRGGENISAVEVEEVLLQMPGIAEAVVVAAPDAALGERVAAVLRLRPGQTMPSLDDVRAHFGGHGVARQKWPEILLEVDDYPRTPSGKVQKRLVRQGLERTLR